MLTTQILKRGGKGISQNNLIIFWKSLKSQNKQNDMVLQI